MSHFADECVVPRGVLSAEQLCFLEGPALGPVPPPPPWGLTDGPCPLPMCGHLSPGPQSARVTGLPTPCLSERPACTTPVLHLTPSPSPRALPPPGTGRVGRSPPYTELPEGRPGPASLGDSTGHPQPPLSAGVAEPWPSARPRHCGGPDRPPASVLPEAGGSGWTGPHRSGAHSRPCPEPAGPVPGLARRCLCVPRICSTSSLTES